MNMRSRNFPREGQMEKEQVSYIMLFCALMLVKNSKATLEQSMTVVPLAGKAKCLAGELVRFAY